LKIQLFLIFLFPGATAHPEQELPHPLQVSDLSNDFKDFNVFINRRITAPIIIIHVIISCIAEGIK